MFLGLYTGLAPLYNSEISPIQYRGAIGTVNQLAVTIAMLIAQVFGLQEIMGTDTLWPLLLGKHATVYFIIRLGPLSFDTQIQLSNKINSLKERR